MRDRRRHRDPRLPSGLAEVELFSFWEADLAGGHTEAPATDAPPEPPDAGLSAAPVWWAMSVLVLALLVVLLLG